MGIITVGLGLGGQIAIYGAVLHMLNHAITKALMFLTFGNVMTQYSKQGIPQKEISGILRSMPFTGAVLSMGGLALVGTPPFNIFMSEFIILWGALARFWTDTIDKNIPTFPKPVVIVAITLFIVSTTLIFYGLIKHLTRLVLGKTANDLRMEKFGFAETGPLVLLFTLMLLLGFYIIPPIANIIRQSVMIILNQVQL